MAECSYIQQTTVQLWLNSFTRLSASPWGWLPKLVQGQCMCQGAKDVAYIVGIIATLCPREIPILSQRDRRMGRREVLYFQQASQPAGSRILDPTYISASDP